MAEHPNVDLVRRGYKAFGDGDLDAVRGFFADDIVWHAGGRNRLTGEYKGVDEVFGFFGKLFELTGGSFSQSVHDILANDEHAAVMVEVTAQRDGRTLDGRVTHVMHVNDDKITEFWAFPEDPYTFDEFWS